MPTRVRFAPSPTGHLHIGGARTALFNYLFARKNAGAFILRIEDTDVERSSAEMSEGIVESMRWLGLDWDEGPLFQSQRLDLYRQAAQTLLEAGQAYRCFKSAAELEPQKSEAQRQGGIWRFDSESRDLDPQKAEARARAGEPHVLRLKVPDARTIRFKDRVFGKIEVESRQIEDFVLLRSDGMPTYHLAVVADDADLQISDVIRGVDHLLNTAKHILIYQALGMKPPKYAHLPMILGPDKKRLSKRHGASSVLEYKRKGLLPAALRNYLALLGWNPGHSREVFDDSSLIREFDLQRVNKADAVFDPQKLEWLNGKHLSQLSAQELLPQVSEALRSHELWNDEWDGAGRDRLLQGIELLKSRMRVASDFATLGRAYFSDDFEYDEAAVARFLNAPERRTLLDSLQELRQSYDDVESFDLESVEARLRAVCEHRDIKAGVLIGAVRVALTGQPVAPGIFDVIVYLGKDAALSRLDRAIRFLQ